MQAGEGMAGGGTAPPLKVGDVLLLVGVSILIGTLFIQEWDQATKINAGDAPLEGTSRTFSGDEITITIQPENSTIVTIEILEDGINADGFPITDDAGPENPLTVNYASSGGKLVWKVTFETEVNADVDVDLDRAYFLNYFPYILGALITTLGVLKKNADAAEKDDVLDAIIEDGDSSN